MVKGDDLKSLLSEYKNKVSGHCLMCKHLVLKVNFEALSALLYKVIVDDSLLQKYSDVILPTMQVIKLHYDEIGA